MKSLADNLLTQQLFIFASYKHRWKQGKLSLHGESLQITVTVLLSLNSAEIYSVGHGTGNAEYPR